MKFFGFSNQQQHQQQQYGDDQGAQAYWQVRVLKKPCCRLPPCCVRWQLHSIARVRSLSWSASGWALAACPARRASPPGAFTLSGALPRCRRLPPPPQVQQAQPSFTVQHSQPSFTVQGSQTSGKLATLVSNRDEVRTGMSGQAGAMLGGRHSRQWPG